MEVWIHDGCNERQQEFILVTDRLDFVVGVENLALVQPQGLYDVLVGVGVDGFLKRLAQQKLAALRCGDVPVSTQHNVVGGKRIGRHKKTQIALDDATLVFGQAVRVFPKRDIAGHIDFLGHPVIGAAGKVFFPGPLVLERHQLVDIGLAIDDPLVGSVYALGRRQLCRLSQRQGCAVIEKL